MFEFATASRIVFGAGVRRQVPALARERGARALLVTGRSAGAVGSVVEDLDREGLAVARYVVSGEPTVEDVRAAVSVAVADRCDLVIALGGGSVIDTGKAIAALAANGGDPLDYVEVVGAGKALTRQSLPCIAAPTTAGSGAEVTRNAVLTVPEQKVKVSLRSPFMLPSVALVDPEMTLDMPPALTASTGLDALAQLIEAYVSTKANPFTDAFCREGMVRCSWSLLAACGDGRDAAARESMSLASLFGGLALANAGLGAVHGLAAPIGGRFAAPHGAVCAALLPHVLHANLVALGERDPGSAALARFDHVARLLIGDRRAAALDAVGWLSDLVAACDIPPLATYGLAVTDVADLVHQARQSNSMRGNPIALTDAELSSILQEAL